MYRLNSLDYNAVERIVGNAFRTSESEGSKTAGAHESCVMAGSIVTCKGSTACTSKMDLESQNCLIDESLALFFNLFSIDKNCRTNSQDAIKDTVMATQCHHWWKQLLIVT